MNILIDCREKKIIERDLPFPYETTALNIGDFELSDSNFTLIIERKTWTDLQSSMKDNRFREQRSRLLAWREERSERRGVVYLIEGLYDFTLFEVERKTVERLMIAYQVPVLFTSSIAKTCETIEKWWKLESLEPLFRKRSLEQDQIESRMKSRTKKNYTDAKLFFMETLCSMKGISFGIAESIAKEYPSLQNFVKEYLDDAATWTIKMNSISYVTPSGKARKLSLKMLELVKENFDFRD